MRHRPPWSRLVVGVVRMRFWDRVGGAQGFGLVHGAHVLGEGVRAGEGAVAFCGESSVSGEICMGVSGKERRTG